MATTLTEAGYVGEDVEKHSFKNYCQIVIIDVEKASTGHCDLYRLK